MVVAAASASRASSSVDATRERRLALLRGRLVPCARNLAEPRRWAFWRPKTGGPDAKEKDTRKVVMRVRSLMF